MSQDICPVHETSEPCRLLIHHHEAGKCIRVFHFECGHIEMIDNPEEHCSEFDVLLVPPTLPDESGRTSPPMDHRGRPVNEEYWVTIDGQEIAVADMDANHVRNTLRMLIKQIRRGDMYYLGGHQKRLSVGHALNSTERKGNGLEEVSAPQGGV